jgi:hypothetical protein
VYLVTGTGTGQDSSDLTEFKIFPLKYFRSLCTKCQVGRHYLFQYYSILTPFAPDTITYLLTHSLTHSIEQSPS